MAGLFAGVDTHPGLRLNYNIYAFGYGVSPETWVVNRGIVTSFEHLEKILWKSVYKDIEGTKGRCYYHVPDENVRFFFHEL